MLAVKDKTIEQLKAEKILLEYNIRELKEKWFSRKKKSPEEQSVEARPKKRGAPKGHPGWYRQEPDHIDVVEEVTLGCCPHCGGKVGECDDIEEHIQEDIVLPRVVVTQYRKHQYWCRRCKAVVSGTGKEELANSYIGPRAKSVAAFLKYDVKVSNNDIGKIFAELCGLRIVPSTVNGFNNQARNKCIPLYESLKEALKKEPYIHADETGCPVDGKNHWDWVFATASMCLHVIREGRGQKVVEEILGKKYGGILLCDFLSAYNKLTAKAKQRCLVHLLRELKKILECSAATDPAHIYCQNLKDLIQKAIALSESFTDHTISRRDFIKQRTALEKSLKDFQFPELQGKTINRITKRLIRHKDELLTFLHHKGIAYHNNFAERMIRPSVLFRKITFGHRSPKGTLNHSVLMSVLQTGKLNGKKSVAMINDIFTCHHTPSLTICGKSP
jgi:transposase